MESSSSKIRNRIRMFALFNIALEILARAIRQECNKKHPDWKRKNKIVCMCAKLLPTLCDPMDEVHQTSLSMGFSRQEYWSGLPRSPPGDLLDPEIKPAFNTATLAREVFTSRATCR